MEQRSAAQARLDALAAAVGIPSIYPAVPIRQQLAALLADCRRAFAASPAAVSPGLAALARVPLCGALPGPPRPPASLALVQARARDAHVMFYAWIPEAHEARPERAAGPAAPASPPWHRCRRARTMCG